MCQFGQFIFGKIIKIVATRSHLLKLKCTKFEKEQRAKGREKRRRGPQNKISGYATGPEFLQSGRCFRDRAVVPDLNPFATMLLMLLLLLLS